MTGICVAAGFKDAEPTVSRVLRRLATNGRETSLKSTGPDATLGLSRHINLTYQMEPKVFQNGTVCCIVGEVYDDHGLHNDAAQLFVDLYFTNSLAKTAWLNGSFASIILDPKRSRVVLITDRFATRPIFVSNTNANLLACSRLGAMIPEPAVAKIPSKQGIAELLSFQRTFADHTQYENIASIPAAQVWVWENGSIKKQTSRRLSWSDPNCTKGEMAEGLAESVKRATAKRLSDPVRHGLFMSGGLDSRMVLAAAEQAGKTVFNATIGAWKNTEVSIAQRCSNLAGMPFKHYIQPAEILHQSIGPATLASHGLFSSPVNFFGTLPAIAQSCDVMLSGHGLDYTLRGYYLPCRTLQLGSSITRLPKLRRIPNGKAETVARTLRVGIPINVIKKILTPHFAGEIDARRIMGVSKAISKAEIENPYNAWDAFILHSVGRHYAYSDFVAMEDILEHREITFDQTVFDLYLSMPPTWRAEGGVAQKAMMILGPHLMKEPDANTGFPAALNIQKQIFLVLLRAAARRFRFARRPERPNSMLTHGSWIDMAEFFRKDKAGRAMVNALPEDPALMEIGLFDREGLKSMIHEHMTEKANYKKLIQQLLAISEWFRAHPANRAAV